MDRQTSSRQLSLRWLLIAPTVLLTLLASGFVAWFALHDSRQAVDDVAAQLRSEVLARVQGQLHEYLHIPLHVNEANVQALQSGLLRLDDPQNVQRYFYSVVKAYPSLAYSFFGTTRGEFYGARRLRDGTLEIVRAGQSTGGDSHNFSTNSLGDAQKLEHVYKNFDPRTRPWYKAGAEAHGPVWTPIYRHFVIHDLALTASQPFYDNDGKLVGVFAVDYVLDRVHEFLHGIRVSKHGLVFVMDRKGELVAVSTAPSSDLIRERDGKFERVAAVDSDLPRVREAARHLASLPGGLGNVDADRLLRFDLDGSPQYLQATGFSGGPGLDWIVAVVAPVADFMGRIETNTRQTLWLIGLAMLLAAALGVLMASRIAAPVVGLSQDAAQLENGRWETRLRPTRIRELSRLALAFQSMSGQLQSSFTRLDEQKKLIEEQYRTLEDRVAERTSELRDVHNRLRAFFENIPGNINIIDREFIIIGVSRGLLDTYGIPDQQSVLGRKCYEALHGRDSICHHCSLQASMQENRHVVRYTTPAEDAVTGKSFKIYAAPIHDESGAVIGGMEYQADISDLRALEFELVGAKETAEAANKAKSDFLARMSHEIRTPMNAILGMTQLTMQSPLSEEQREFLDIVHYSASHLLAVINDILDISKIEARRLSLESRDFDLYASLETTVATLAPQAQGKGLELQLDIHEETPRYLRGDDTRLRQIVYNLLGNALKFTEAGGVQLRVRPQQPPPDTTGAQEATAERLLLEFEVEDSGIGVPEDKRLSIFDPFSQAEDGATRKYGGTGLGLSICRQLVRLMGGDIRLQDKQGQGSLFVFNAAFAPGSEEKVSAQQAGELDAQGTQLPPLSILLAEDTAMNVRVATAALGRQGHRVTVAATGRQALDLLQKQPFDLVLMDVEMPEMNGLEATSRIREGEAGEENRTIPVIALTAHALQEHRERCLAAGMDAYVSKPVNFPELHTAMARCMANSKRSLVLPPPEGPHVGADPAGEAMQPPAASPTDPAGLLPLSEHIDVPEALERFAGDVELLLEAVARTAATLPEKLQKLQEALESDDVSEARFHAHTMKGNLATVGAARLAAAAAEIEDALHVRNTDLAASLLPGYKLGLSALLAEIPETMLDLFAFLRAAGNPLPH